MNGLDYILSIHRREDRRAEAAFDLLFIGIALLGYGAYRLICWLV